MSKDKLAKMQEQSNTLLKVAVELRARHRCSLEEALKAIEINELRQQRLADAKHYNSQHQLQQGLVKMLDQFKHLIPGFGGPDMGDLPKKKEGREGFGLGVRVDGDEIVISCFPDDTVGELAASAIRTKYGDEAKLQDYAVWLKHEAEEVGVALEPLDLQEKASGLNEKHTLIIIGKANAHK